MKKQETYLNLCTQVYDLSKPHPPAAAYAFYRDYLVKANGPVLEPMCGSGRFLLPLLAEGFDVHGFDASECMLAALSAKARARNLVPTVWNSTIAESAGQGNYALIFIPSGSFSLITDLEAIASALTCLYQHLRDDGVFVFEIDTLHALPPLSQWRGSAWHKADGDSILLSLCATLQDDICRTVCKYELVHDHHIIDTEVEELTIRMHHPDTLADILKRCGFRTVRLLKAFDFQLSPNDNDESIVYECRK